MAQLPKKPSGKLNHSSSEFSLIASIPARNHQSSPQYLPFPNDRVEINQISCSFQSAEKALPLPHKHIPNFH